jgi:peptidoglycan/LPS O-acetylase OafA/YrhL
MTSPDQAAPQAAAADTGRTSDAIYYPGFDWLRATLAIVVMLGHDNLIAWHDSGTFAVDVFFALSGWLIGGILVKLEVRQLPRFFFNRSMRIWLPYYIGLALLLGVSLLRDKVTDKWLEFVSYKVLMVWNLFGSSQVAGFRDAMPLQSTGNHFWSVNAEEQFYLLAPLLLVVAARWGRSMGLWALLALIAWRIDVYPSIFLGVLAALAAARWPGFQLRPWVRGLCLAVGFGAAVGLVVGQPYIVLAPLCAISIVLLLATPGTASRLGTIAGGMSYPLYLNHWIGVFVGNALLGPFGLRNSPPRQVLACLISIGFAVAHYHWIDRQVLQRRSAWYTPERGRLLMVVAYTMVCCGLVWGFYMRYR